MASMDMYCTKCSLQFDKKIIFDMHLSIVHKEIIDIKKEPTCSTLMENSDETRSTSVQEKKKPFKCDMCDYSFSEKGSLKRHIASVHEGKKPFKCDVCSYSASERANLKRHIESVHEGIKYICVICDKGFSSKSHLNRHVSSVHQEKTLL